MQSNRPTPVRSHRVRPAIVLFSVLALAACASAGPPPGPYVPHDGLEGEGVLGSWVHSGGYRREYILSLPPEVAAEPERRAERSWPLLIVMHGAGATAAGLHRWIDPDSATSAAGFIAVYPDGLDESWDLGCPACTSASMQGVDDIQFVHTLIDHLADSLPIDTSRVVIAGHSLGAQFVHYYACESDRPPAAIAAFSGLWLRRTSSACTPRAPVSVMMVHGDRDRILPWEGPRRNATALSMPIAWEGWNDLLQCPSDRRVTQRQDEAGDGTTVESWSVEGCDDGTSVELHRLRGAGHGWPGPVRPVPPLGPHTRNFDGLKELLRFFSNRVAG